MKKEVNAKNTRRFGGILYWTVGCLLMLTMVSVWLVCGLFAKYITSDADGDTARVAATGVVDFRVLEHQAVNVSADYTDRVYNLTDTVVKSNEYQTIPPGYDIPKDPFVRLELVDSEVDYYLYVKVIKSDEFPSTVEVKLSTEDWEPVAGEKDLYRFIGNTDTGIRDGYIDAGTLAQTDFYILEENQIKVSQYYKGEAFNVSFEAYLVQVD